LRNSVRFASPTGRLTPQLAEDPYLLTSSSKVSLQNVKLGFCMNLSFDRKVMLVVRVIYIYIIATSISLISITLGLYVLSSILNESNAALPNILLVKLLY
jgi:hypothetical protein